MSDKDEAIRLTPTAIEAMIEEMKEGKLSRIIYEQFPTLTVRVE